MTSALVANHNKKRSGALIAGIAIVASAMIPVSAVLADTIVPAADQALDAAATPMTDQDFADAQPAALTEAAVRAVDDAEIECMAKVVLHEAGSQSHEGRLAVAQLIRNRVESGRFADTVCGVANQPGQFFNTAAYNPKRDARWDDAVALARRVMGAERAEGTAAVAPGALFFHAAYQPATRFFRTRTRVATLGGNVFYR